MSLQSHGLRRMFLRGVSGVVAGTGSLLLTAALAIGADVTGPPAEGFKTQVVDKSLSTNAKEKRTREDLVIRIIRGAPLAGNEGVFDSYYSTYLFPLWTQTTEKNLNELPKERDKFVRNNLELSAKNPEAHGRLIGLTHTKLAEIVQDAEFHPAVRFNAILIIGLLNEVEPNRGTGVKQMPEPYILALSTLTEELKKPGNNEAVRVGALLGVSRHLEWDNSKKASAKIQAAVRQDIIAELTNIVNTKIPPAGRSAEGQTWLRRRALEALGHAYALKVEGDFDKLLDGIISDDAEPISLRCTAAEVMSRVDYQAPVMLPVSAMSKKLGYLALYACHSEFVRLEGLKKKDEELLKMSGSAPAGGGGGGGGGMPGGAPGGAMPGGAPMGSAGGGAGAMPGAGGGAGRKGNMGGGLGGKDLAADPKGYRVDYSKRRLRAELYAIELALGREKNPTAGLTFHAKTEPDKATLKGISEKVKDVIRIVEELNQSAEVYEKALRKEMKKLELLTKALPVAAKADPAKGPAEPGEEDPMGAKPAPAKPAGEEPMEDIPLAAPAKGPATPAKGGPPAATPPDGGKAAPAEAGKGAPAAEGKGGAPPAPPAGKK